MAACDADDGVAIVVGSGTVGGGCTGMLPSPVPPRIPSNEVRGFEASLRDADDASKADALTLFLLAGRG